MALIGRPAIPVRRSRIVLRNTLAIGIHAAKIKLSAGVALISGPAIPVCRSRVVLRDPSAVFVHETETALSVGIALLGKRPPDLHRDGIVAALVSGHAVLFIVSPLGCSRMRNDQKPNLTHATLCSTHCFR